MNLTSFVPPVWRSLLLRIVLIPVVATINFTINLFPFVMAVGEDARPTPPLLRLFWVGAVPSASWVITSIPVQWATRRLARTPIAIAIAAHIVGAALFLITQCTLTIGMREILGMGRPGLPFVEQVQRLVVGSLPLNLMVYAALVAGTLAWDNWRLSVHRERTAARLIGELARAELAALRSKIQPHFLFNALHGISSVMDTDVPRARQMMVALSNLLRSSLNGGGDTGLLEHEVQFTRDYLELQQMRFEDRLLYDLQVDARSDLRVPSFILQPLVENAVVHGMADRSETTRVRVSVRELADEVKIEVSDDGPGFPQEILDGSTPLGVGLGALQGRLQAMPGGGRMTLRNRPDGGAQVVLRVPTFDDDDGSHA